MTTWQNQQFFAILRNFAELSFINQLRNLTFDTKNQFLDPKLVEFGILNVKIGLELSKLWQK